MIGKMGLMRMGLVSAMALSSPAFAGPVVLTGNYIKTAVSDYGTLGSDGNSQPGLQHDPNGMGMFDPNHDYISPGIPHDGFSLHADQFAFMQNDNDGVSNFGTASPTLLTGAAANGYTNAATWSGGLAGLVGITNSYFFNAGDERVLVTTTITALSDLTNLAFARSVDPDPDNYYPGGSADTNNQRGNSLFGVDDFVGSAGTISGLTLALVNVDAAGLTHTTSINSDCCSNIDPYDVLSHSVAAGDTGTGPNTGDYGLNLAYSIGSLMSGSSITISYAYAVGDKIETTGTAGGVPEPASWAMMIAGLGLVGGVLRRRTAVRVTYA